MPNIREYTETAGIQPSETGIEATAQAARRIGMFYNQVGESEARLGQQLGSAVKSAGDAYVQYQTDSWEAKAGPTKRRILYNKTIEYEKLIKNSDPNNDSIGKKFIGENLEPTLNQFIDTAPTEQARNKAQAFADETRLHFSRTIAADQVRRTGEAQMINTATTVNHPSKQGMANPTPEAMDLAMETAKSSIKDDKLLFKGQEAIAKAGVFGYLQRSGGEMPPWISKYDKYIDTQELLQFQRAAKAFKAQGLADARAAKVQQQNDLADAAAKKADEIRKEYVDPETGEWHVPPGFGNKLMSDDTFHANKRTMEERKELLAEYNYSTKGKGEAKVSDSETVQRFMNQLFNDDPSQFPKRSDFYKAEIENKLSPRDKSAFLGLYDELEKKPIQDPVFKQAMDAVSSKLGANLDTEGKERKANFSQSFIQQYLDTRLQVKSQPNSLVPKDPESLISKALEPFQRTPEEMLNAHILRGLELGGGLPLTPTPQPLATTSPSTPKVPTVGEVRGGFRFKGGNPPLEP